ncbi:MAG: 50S ribosomal protein L6 [Halieaceae bacterium]|jgi:large subunit ribosomal protein L6|nr:50S ribosomal protein L6 [Halieaceae bacterium]
MSRVAKSPVNVPKGVEVTLNDRALSVKGGKGSLSLSLTDGIQVVQEGEELMVSYDNDAHKPMAGTTRMLVNNMVVGVSTGWQKKLVLNGVGYRAKAEGSVLNLTLGLSHPVNYELPQGVSAETPSQTEVVVSGIDKQAVGQAAAEIRAFRPPEPYKGKGIRYADEHVRRKDAKKK